jgi:iron complex transport system ATP-binding protein
MLNVKDLTVERHDTKLLDRVSTSVNKGELCVVLGPNGSGKTTFLRALASSIKYDGAIEINGTSLQDHKPAELARVRAYAQQEPAYPPDMTVEHYVMLARAPYQQRLRGPSQQDHSAKTHALDQCAINHLATRKLGSLSGGERRRAALAQALAQRTPLVLLDEPTTALDIGQQQAMLELIDAIRIEQQTTFVVALHDLTFARQFATQVLFLHGGKLVEDGTPETVLQISTLEKHYETTLVEMSEKTTYAIVPRRSGIPHRPM